MTNLSIVVPCYNEQAALPATIARLCEVLGELVARGAAEPASTITFVDDGSRDATWAIIEAAARANPAVCGIKLSRNRGHQNAVLAGLLSVDGDAVVSIDADLQDDPAVIAEMLEQYQSGAEIVYGVRRSRRSDNWFKRWSAESYYRILKRLGVDVVFNHADFRLMGRRAIEALRDYGEVNVFLRGIVPDLGFHSACVEYARTARTAGETHYPLRRMLALAWDGLTSFSAVPLRWITVIGMLISVFSFGAGCWSLAIRIFTDRAVPGWTSTVVPMFFLGGIQLLSLGIIGEYVAKVYAETKRRPRFVIDKRAGSRWAQPHPAFPEAGGEGADRDTSHSLPRLTVAPASSVRRRASPARARARGG
jgi:glycosyltransferase involved in cell wall biosynthesis